LVRVPENMTQTSTATTANTSRPPLEVYFDGSCPLCVREINFYRRRMDDDASVRFVDVSPSSTAGRGDLPDDLDPETAMARFHVRDRDGRLLSGARAFAELWRAVPGWETLGRIGGLPGIRHVLEAAYRGFLLFRPGVQAIVRRFDGGGDCDTACRR